MIYQKIIKGQLILLVLFNELKNGAFEQSPESSIGFNLDERPLQTIPLIESIPVQNDLINIKFNIPEENVPENILDESADDSNFKPPWYIQPTFIPSGGSDECKKHTQMYVDGLKSWKKWSIQMWDGTGKLGAGLFSGNANQLGDFHSCLKITAPKGLEPNYCLAAIDLMVTNDAPPVVQDIVHKIQGENFIRTTQFDTGHFIPRYSTLAWGICLPKSCTKDSILSGLQTALQPLNSTPGLIVHTGIPKYSCYEKPDSPPLSTILTISFFVFVLILSIIATIIDITNNEWKYKTGNGNRILMAFSLKRGINDLLEENRDEFPSINGVRALCSMILYVAHKLMPLTFIIFSNRNLLTQHSNTVWSSVLRASTVYTDSFLFLSGVLSAHNLSKEITTKGYIKWPTRIIARLIRLTPALMAVLLYYAYIMEYVGTGPQWGTIVRANADLCKAGLWKNFLYIQNFFKFEEMCAPQTHQLALDMHMFLLAPAIIYILHHEQSLGLALITAIGGASAVLRFYTTYTNNLSTFIRHGVTSSELFKTANLSYGQTTHRIIPYFTGIALGYFLYKSKKMTQICIDFKSSVLGWTLCIIGLLYSIFSQTHLAMQNHKYDPLSASLYAAIVPITTSASLSWIIYMCHMNRGGPLEKLLNSRFLLIISRLSYSIYLTQFAVFYYNSGSVSMTEELTPSDVIPFSELMTVLFASIFITLLFDFPMKEIKNALLSGNSKKSRKPD
ncbi:nose resistant to fluoxetine protein 6-like [Lycorma delicatula]|uniref:nose resistant to fluoxetine protein 6-like n=1 Tax=Lycorma delicatula TaxID=130591 RepID=UPI003F519157